ncbi:hypothetical protein GCM10018952_52860 [Streptosporangium vulgare]
MGGRGGLRVVPVVPVALPREASGSSPGLPGELPGEFPDGLPDGLPDGFPEERSDELSEERGWVSRLRGGFAYRGRRKASPGITPREGGGHRRRGCRRRGKACGESLGSAL